MYNREGKNIRDRISDIYRESDWGYYLLRPFYLLYTLGLKIIPDKFIIKSSFKKHMGYTLDLDNPQTLNEKINWLKLYDRDELHTLVADKYKVRAYVEKKIGAKYLIPLLYQTKDSNNIRPENLPDNNYIIKTNHDSSGGVIVRESSEIDWNSTRKRFKRLLKENHYYSTIEWQYKNIEPRIIVEKLLTNDDGSIPDDYKCHCFNGKLEFVMIDFDRHTNKRTRNLYDSNWNLIPCNWGRPYGRDVPRPENFEELKFLAETLAKDFKYVRVDFYLVKGHIYFGEITFHHASGFQKFYTDECDYKFGQLLNLD
ncbi:teichuronopeptide biosynthesis TupA-like protein [Winogradskyella epiphytica]|uniref:Teichuronopeptide biosynthesis TupA-like protein n=1 Tax=Winogradskyella epiphytica TaxID=262005 RepID=A0A2V4WWT8_9FLAO|nr:ATP-grasp fold amidoligase family protein [Winogradskyella epiphytica]PYE81706.1 teichuronopeptide biosynthesis TupA-like protein [Winogradskyella epiphytica]GGW63251.1 glycosyl transferase [Winogradskyella epiphytica]